MMTYETIAAAYVDTWNATEADRKSLLAGHWDSDAHYVDPIMSGSGHDGIAAMITAARGQFPGHVFELDGAVDGYGDHLRFSWLLLPPGGTVVARGTDFVRLGTDGRIASVVGFLDVMPS